MVENKTTQTDGNVDSYIEAILKSCFRAECALTADFPAPLIFDVGRSS
jgi:hypothetical protein